MGYGKSLAALASTWACTTGLAIAQDDAITGLAPPLRMPDTMLSLRDMYPGIGAAPADASATREYRPDAVEPGPEFDTRRVSMPAGNLPVTSAWQRLGDFRSASGVRLLTLWRATAGSIALHEGRHGGISLQWTSQDASRGSVTRGLFDHLVASVRTGGATSAATAVTVGARPTVREPAAREAVTVHGPYIP